MENKGWFIWGTKKNGGFEIYNFIPLWFTIFISPPTKVALSAIVVVVVVPLAAPPTPMCFISTLNVRTVSPRVYNYMMMVVVEGGWPFWV